MALPQITKMMSKLKPKSQGDLVSVSDARMPVDEIAYVIGDIHGRNDLLAPLLDRIVFDAAQRKFGKTHLILLGDYVDRGGMSRDVLDTVINLDLPDIHIVTLDGNHEASMRAFLEDPVKGKRWLHYGGDATLKSYDIDLTLGELLDEDLHKISSDLKEAMPAAHQTFLAGLTPYYALGDFYFAHAGINPKLPLSDQIERDLLWIRSDFLRHDGLYEKVIVHGHSITPAAEFKDNRIGIDTGAFYSNELTCLVLEGSNKDLL